MRTTLASGTPVELARPADGRGAQPGLVLIPDIMGLRPLFDDHAQRLADEHGWAVAAVEPWPGREDLPLEERLAAGRHHRRPGASWPTSWRPPTCSSVEPVGVIGFCMGGMFTLKAAGTGRFDRAVGVLRDAPGARRTGRATAHDRAARRGPRRRAPARRSPSSAPSTSGHRPTDVAAAEAAGVTVVRYEGADHGFVHDPIRPAHRADDAADAWRRAIAFLSE